jgi:hypothetical protein
VAVLREFLPLLAQEEEKGRRGNLGQEETGVVQNEEIKEERWSASWWRGKRTTGLTQSACSVWKTTRMDRKIEGVRAETVRWFGLKGRNGSVSWGKEVASGKMVSRKRESWAREREGPREGFYFISKICFLFDFKTGFENNL